MTAKEYLQQASQINVKLKAMAEQLEFLKSAAVYVSPRYSNMPKTATPNIRKNEDAIIRVIEFTEKMQEQYEKLSEINRAIDSVSNSTAQSILVKRYIQNNSWIEIARGLYISESRVYQLHREALAEIEKTVVNCS